MRSSPPRTRTRSNDGAWRREGSSGSLPQPEENALEPAEDAHAIERRSLAPEVIERLHRPARVGRQERDPRGDLAEARVAELAAARIDESAGGLEDEIGNAEEDEAS